MYSLCWCIRMKAKELQRCNILLLVLIIVTLLVSVSDQSSEIGFCDAADNFCSEPEKSSEQPSLRQSFSKRRLILYDVNPPEGFNLRRDVYMRFAIMLVSAQLRGNYLWELVLPPWHRLYHWRSTTKHNAPLPWSHFFDLKSLKSYAPVLELHEVFSESQKNFKIDTLYVLQNFDDPFEGGKFTEKWEIMKPNDCRYDGAFWGYSNVTYKEKVCVRFQGKTSKLWELVSLHPTDKIVMFAHGEIALHDNYGSKEYWQCRRSMQFSKELVDTAKNYISEEFDCVSDRCSGYLAVHWRRQDFARGRGSDAPSVAATARQIIATLKPLKLNKVFIATDASNSELGVLVKQLQDKGVSVSLFTPTKEQIDHFRDGGIAVIEQVICSHAAYFIGTHESTFSFRIQEEREILGFDSKTTFNRFCPDSGHCEPPSKWTIID